ncbi:RecQ family ATP-dependent DNA helicase [Bacillus sp. 1P06AnD]|uniref:RecQ family ATP-dependent DNA helicase n=1 Tax=Bacillus sp. 1P06AnD TaxID=3132208 RepID=UPI0039A197A7
MHIKKALKTYFGYDSFRPGQEETVRSIIEGRHTIATLATGTGKSLCYQLPTYMSGKTTLIVSPLLSLMQDQVDQLKMKGEKRAIALTSFLKYREKADILKSIGDYRFIFLSPEMLSIPSVVKSLATLDIGLFTVDEAHCISQWGYDFRPDYLRLGEVREQLGNPLTLALTATATEEVRQDIRHYLNLAQAEEVVSSIDRENIGLFVEQCSSHKEKEERLFHLAQSLKKPGIIYFSSKKQAESMALFLEEKGIGGVGYYHAGMEQEQRILIQQQFLQNQLQVICATNAFGMGINKDNVRFVIHYHMPSSMEAYLQEIGRAGRDGKKSVAILLYCPGDESLPLFLIDSERPSDMQLDAFFAFMDGKYGENIAFLTSEQLKEGFSHVQFTEVQERIVMHYLTNRTMPFKAAIDKLKSVMEAVSEKKKWKWTSYYHWLMDTTSCYREGIKEYFQEEKSNQKPFPCCTNCNADISFYYSLEKEEGRGRLEGLEMDWKKELAYFLKAERESYEQ